VHGGVGAGQLAGESDHKAQRQLGDGDRVSAGCVHDDDATAGRGFGIDVVHAHARADNHAKLRRCGHQGVIHLHGRAYDKGIGVGHGFGKIFNLIVRENLPSGFGLKNSQRRRGDFFREDDFHCSLS